MTHNELTKKVETLIAELKAEGVRFAIFTKNDKRCDISIDCTNKDFIKMFEEFAEYVQNPFAEELGENLVSIGLALLKVHNKVAFDIVKQNIAEL